MVPYSADDYKKYIYAEGVHWIWRVREILEHLDLDQIDYDDIDHLLGFVQIALFEAAFTKTKMSIPTTSALTGSP